MKKSVEQDDAAEWGNCIYALHSIAEVMCFDKLHKCSVHSDIPNNYECNMLETCIKDTLQTVALNIAIYWKPSFWNRQWWSCF